MNKIWNIEIDVYAIFKVKYGLNVMHSAIFASQVGGFNGKGIDIHPWGLKIKPHKLHSYGWQLYANYTYFT
jgi:hypothetical protein